MELDILWNGLLGGALIGLAASLLYLGLGRIAGVSGMLGALLSVGQSPELWRILFLLGISTGGFLTFYFFPETNVSTDDLSWGLLIPAGFLVGLGSSLGSGCTSGHGICGVSRLSKRSLVATAIFMITGIVTASLMGILL